MTGRLLAVCLHDVEADTLDRCRLIREWLYGRGVERITLLVVPRGSAGAMHPDEGCAQWLRERTLNGDALAQHGLCHRRTRRASRARDWIADRQGGDAAEFVGLTRQETIAAIDAGRRLLSAAGLKPNGFIAPAYAYTRILRRELRQRFVWYAGLLAIHGTRRVSAPAHGLGTSTAFKRRTSPGVLRTGARLPARVLRVDIHPADFQFSSHVAALAAVIDENIAERSPVTYDELAS